MMVLVAGLALGATTFVTPTTGATMGGQYVVNVTSTLANLANCTVTGTSALSGDTFTVTLINGSHTYANGTLNVTAERDAGDWVLSGTCYNSSGSTQAITQITAVKTDSTVPAISACTFNSATAANGQTTAKKSNTLVCTIARATSCNLYYKTSTAKAMSSDGEDYDCTFTSTSSYAGGGTTATCSVNSAAIGNNAWHMDCTDGVNTTTGTSYTFKLLGEDKDDSGTTTTTGGTSSLAIGGMKGTVTLILVVASAAMVILLIVNHSRKR